MVCRSGSPAVAIHSQDSSVSHLAQSASHLCAGNTINSTLLRFQYPIVDFGSRLFQGEDGCSPSANSDFLMVTQMVSSAEVQIYGIGSQIGMTGPSIW